MILINLRLALRRKYKVGIEPEPINFWKIIKRLEYLLFSRSPTTASAPIMFLQNLRFQISSIV